MLTEIYIEALLVNEELADQDVADQVWDAWNAGEIDDLTAWVTWWRVANYAILNL